MRHTRSAGASPARAAGALVVAVLLLSLGGCKWLGKSSNKENIDPPAELTDFTSSVEIDKVWDASIGKGERRLLLRQAPAIADGRVYTGNLKGELQALEAATGRPVWEVDTGLRLSGGPGIGEGTLVIGTLDGDVVAVNPDTGTERWRARVSSEVTSRPAIGRGVAVVRTIDGRVFGLSIIDGSRRWVYDRGLPTLTLRGNAAPVIAAGNVYIGYDSGDVVSLSLDEGSEQWVQRVAEPEGRTELERMVDVDGEIVINGGELYAASFKNQLMAMDPASGRPLWTRDLTVFTGITLAGDRLLVSDKAGTVWALDRRSGAAVWRQDGLAHRWLTTPAVHGDYAVVGDLEGYLHWLKLDSGEFAARERVDSKPIRATPQVDGDLLYAVSTHGDLSAFRISR